MSRYLGLKTFSDGPGKEEVFGKVCDNVMYSSCVCVTVCFVQTIVSWSGSKSNMFERQKVREFAALIRDTERHSKATETGKQFINSYS